MSIISTSHAATNIGTGDAVSGALSELHTHTTELVTSAGNGSGTVIHYGRNGTSPSWHEIVAFTFSADPTGTKQSVTLQHRWDQYKSECTAISGTNAVVHSTVS